MRQISEAEQQIVLQRQGLRCFIDHHPIESEGDVEYDHIRPYSEDGTSHIDNIAVVCKRHNREKRTLSLSEFRDRLELRKFFEGAKKRRLDDLLQAKLGADPVLRTDPLPSVVELPLQHEPVTVRPTILNTRRSQTMKYRRFAVGTIAVGAIAIAAAGVLVGFGAANGADGPSSADESGSSFSYIPSTTAAADISSFETLRGATLGDIPAAVVSAVELAGSRAVSGRQVGQDAALKVSGYLVVMQDGWLCFALSDPVKTGVTCRDGATMGSEGVDMVSTINGTSYEAGVRGDSVKAVTVSGKSVPVNGNFFIAPAS